MGMSEIFGGNAALLGAHKIFYFSMRDILPSSQDDVSFLHRILPEKYKKSLFFR
jgi:hypothetical protein